MLPKKELNIYLKNEENVNALLSFYFDKYNLDKDNSVETVMKNSNLALNQIEFIVRKLSESFDEIFKPFFTNGKTSIANLLRYGIDGLAKNEKDWSFGPTSSGRPKIKEFIEFVKQTEIDYDFLEKNN